MSTVVPGGPAARAHFIVMLQRCLIGCQTLSSFVPLRICFHGDFHLYSEFAAVSYFHRPMFDKFRGSCLSAK
jgi:hypothetical protein